MSERACLKKSRRRRCIRHCSVPGLKLATFSLVSLFLVPLSVQAQTPQPQRPAPHEKARPGIAQDFLARLRQLAPSPHRQSRAASRPPPPRPRPAELTPTPVQTTPVQPSPTFEELAPASVQPDQTPAEDAPAPKGRLRPLPSTTDRR
jgi:hypothetical protein